MANAILIWIAQQGINTFGMYSVGVDLMLSGGLRLSELLLADAFFVNQLGQVRIEGRKGSADKLVAPLYHRDWWLARVGWVANPFNFVSRWSWYRFFVRKGVLSRRRQNVLLGDSRATKIASAQPSKRGH